MPGDPVAVEHRTGDRAPLPAPAPQGDGTVAFDVDLAWLRSKPGIKWQAVGADGFAAWVADMDWPPPPPVLARLQARLDVGDLGYPNWGVLTRSPLPEVFAARMLDRFGWSIDPDQTIELADVLQGVQIVLHHLSQPGDGVVLHLPAYSPFLTTLEEMGRVPVPIPAERTPAGWEFDLDALDERLETQPARAMILCHPHNPTGRVFARPELERIAAIADRHDLVVISDEIHADLVLPPHRHVPFASLGPDVEARTVTLTSATKAFNLAGLRWAIAHVGSRVLRDTLAGLPSHLHGVPNLMAAEATDAAWTESSGWLDQTVAAIDRNQRRVVEAVPLLLPGVDVAPAQATYLAWLDCRALGWKREPAEMFHRVGVALGSGPEFGAPGFVRLNVATSPGVLDAILDRMATALPPR